MNQMLFDALLAPMSSSMSASASMGGTGDLLSQLDNYGAGQRAMIEKDFPIRLALPLPASKRAAWDQVIW